MDVLDSFEPRAVAAGLLVVLLLAGELGCRLGRRVAPRVAEVFRSEFATILAAVLALLGLLLAFTLSMAADRYETRRLLVVEEANAIGTAWLRSDALPEPARSEARALLRTYVDTRLDFYAAGDDAARIAAAVAHAEQIQAAVWALTMDAAQAAPGSLPLQLDLEALNTVIDLHALRVTALQARVPGAILAVLLVVGVTGIVVVGFVFGLGSGRHRGATALLALLLSGIVYVVLDLDLPRRGHIRVSQASMERLRDSLDQAGR